MCLQVCGACRATFVPTEKSSICKACVAVMQRMSVVVRREPLAYVNTQLQHARSLVAVRE